MGLNVKLFNSQRPVDDFGLPFSKTIYSADLAAATDTTLTVPSTAKYFKAVITVESGGDVWVALNATAAVPAGAAFASTTSELVNGSSHRCREVEAGDVIHFITASANTTVSVAFYQSNITS